MRYMTNLEINRALEEANRLEMVIHCLRQMGQYKSADEIATGLETLRKSIDQSLALIK